VFDKFIRILKKYDVNLSSNQKNEILMALPGKESSGLEEEQQDGHKIKIINISRIYDQKFNIIT
jgi:hypothetical protein